MLRTHTAGTLGVEQVGQIVTLTYPHISNVGVNPEDTESRRIFAAGLVIRDLPALASSWRRTQDLGQFLTSGNVVGIADIDTRKLTRILREKGAQNGCIVASTGFSEADEADAVARAKAATATEKITLTLDAKDTSNGDRAVKYKEAIADCSYFQAALGKTNEVKLVNLMQDMLGPEGRKISQFTLECRYPEKTR